MHPILSSHRRRSGFSLVELLVAMAILAGVMALVFSTTDETAKLWKRTTSKIEQFQAARSAFEAMTRRISQATLNTYYEYYDANGNVTTTAAVRYDRYSELHFLNGFPGPKQGLPLPPGASSSSNPGERILSTIATRFSGTCIAFQAPLGYSDPTKAPVNTKNLNNLMNSVGYWVEYGNVSEMPQFIASLPGRGANTNILRYRLMQFLEPTHLNQIYTSVSFTPSAPSRAMNDWFTTAASLDSDSNASRRTISGNRNAYRQTLAENVVLLVTLPQLPQGERNNLNGAAASTANARGEIAPKYVYNSRVGVGNKSGFDLYSPVESNGNKRSRQLHQLPPQVRVVMVAIDEDSAERLVPAGSNPPTFMSGAGNGLFVNSLDLDIDLKEYTSRLQNNTDNVKINYRIFDRVIPIQAAKWSSD